MKLKTGILGGSGYTGIELFRILLNHPQAEVTTVTSRKYAGQKVSEVFPALTGISQLVFSEPDLEELAGASDIVFTCVPHQTAMDVVPFLLEKGVKVIDLSADFRLRDRKVYEEWYQEHSAPGYLKEAVYGLPELYGSSISGARLVANPGCYPTSCILPLVPLLKADLVKPDDIIIDSKSGASGAGRGATTATLFCEVNEGFKAYKIAEHRHTPEIEQELSAASGSHVIINFTPHLVPMSRGILSTIYAAPASDAEEAAIRGCLVESYAASPFVQILPAGSFPNVLNVRGTNFCHIGLRLDRRTGRLIIVSVIDNLCRGASGQAVQNMNLMSSLEEGLGLGEIALYP